MNTRSDRAKPIHTAPFRWSIILLIALSIEVGVAVGGVVQFDNSCVDGNWHTCCSIGGGNFENNWDLGPGGACPLPLPGPADDVDLGGHTVVHNQATVSINSLTSTGEFTKAGFSLSAAQGIVLNEFNLSGGPMSAGGPIVINGPLNSFGGEIRRLGNPNDPPVVAQFLGGVNITTFLGLDLSGLTTICTEDVLWQGGDFGLNEGTEFDSQAMFVIECDEDMNNGAPDATFINNGALVKRVTTGSTIIRSRVEFESHGPIDIETGSLVLQSTGFSKNTFNTSDGATLFFGQGGSDQFTLDEGTLFAGTGQVRSSSNALIIPQNVAINGNNFELLGGNLIGPGILSTQLFKWNGGTIDGAEVSALQVLDIDGFLSKTLSASSVGPATLTNFFGATWKGTGDIILNTVGVTTNGVTLVNEQAAVFDIKNDERLSGSGTFINFGIVQKSEGAQTTTFDGIFYQNGGTSGGRGAGAGVKTEVQIGTLLIDGPGENAVDATFDVSSNAFLVFQPQGGETFVMRGDGDTITGDGLAIKTGSGVLNVPDMNHFGANNLRIAAGTLSGPGLFTAKNVEWTGGTFLDLDPVANPGDPQNPFLSTATESLNINGFLSKTLSGGTFVNEMDGVWTGNGFWNFADAVFINQGSLAAMDLHPSQNLRAFFTSGVSLFENNGTMTCTGDVVEFSVTNGSGNFINNNLLINTAGVLNFGSGVALDNNGTVDVQSGDVVVRGGTCTGQFTVSGGELFFRSTPYDMAHGSFIFGPGPAVVDNVLRILGFVQADVIEIFATGGAIEGLGTLDIVQSMIFANGAMRDAGATVIKPSATLTILGTGPKTIEERVIDVQGLASFQGTGDLFLDLESEIVVNGSFEADSGGDITHQIGSNGIITVNPSATFTTISPLDVTSFVTFNNHGTVNVGAGAGLELGGGGDFTDGVVNILGASTTGLDDLEFVTLFPWTFNNTDIFGPGRMIAGFNTVINVTGDSRIDNLELIGTIDGPADLFVFDNFHWRGSGTMKGSGSTTATGQMVIEFANLDGRTFNNNALGIWPSSTITSSNGGVFNNINSLDIQGGLGWAVGAGGGTINNTGQFIRTTDPFGTVNIAPTFNHQAGKVQSQLGDLCFTGAFNQSGGIVQTNLSGTVSFTGPGGLNKTGGQILGTGAIVGNVTNGGGAINPGNTPGTLSIDGDLFNTTNGLIDVELAGLLPGTEHDEFSITGTATLGGTLRLLPTDGFIPQVGDSFTILTAASVAGAFDAVVGPGQYTIDYNSNGVLATVTAAPACSDLSPIDLNYDCAIDLEDYAFFADCHGGPNNSLPPTGCATASFVTADLDFDGDADLADFAQMQLLFNAP